MSRSINAELAATIRQIESMQVDPERRPILDQLATWIRTQRMENPHKPIQVTFICTHNSRRSQLAQAWLAALASRNGLSNIQTFSGGTEVTAFHPHAVESLERAGFHIRQESADRSNPHYDVRFSSDEDALLMYSKRYDDPANPDHHFAAVMVCSEAEAACPYVSGAQFRLALPYLDPKRSDESPDAPQVYNQCSMEIATEMNYVIQQILFHE